MLWIKYCLTLSLLLALVGCQEAAHSTSKEKATRQWNEARASVLFSLAHEQYKNGNFNKSRQSLDEALKLDPENSRLHVLSAKLAIEQGQMELAERELNLARTLDSKNAEAEYLSGVVYQRWQQPQTALECYSRACDKAPAELSYILAKAEMLVAIDHLPDALALLQSKAVYFEHSGAIRDAIGQLYLQQKNYPQAVEYLRQASILTPDDFTIREHLALALYYATQYREAADHLGRILQEQAYTKRADLFAALGECQLRTGRPRDARDSYETAVQLDPGSASLWLGQAKAAFQLNDFKRAELSLRKSLSLEPARSETHLMLGYLHFRQNHLDQALTSFQQASRLDPSDPVSLCMIGYTLAKAGKSEEAIQYYAKALKQKPNDELATRLMAGASLHD